MLDDRKKKILSAIIAVYTRTGEPVGSKLICEEVDLDLSPATIRKEMSELLLDGYLLQPHTSAGRIPSEKGYRTYIDNLMPDKELSFSQKEAIRNLFPKAPSPDELLESAGKVLANLTNCTVFTSVPRGEETKLRRVEIISMGKRAVMLVVVTDTGVIKTRFCYGFSGLDENFCKQFSIFANEILAEQKLSDINEDLLKQIALQLPEHILKVAPILSEFGILIEEANRLSIKLEGEANLFNHKEIDSASAKGILELLTKQEAMSEILKAKGEVLSVLIGEETSYYQLKGASVVMRSYKIGNGGEGQIGIIGPVRMNYPEMISNIDYFAELLGEIYGNVIEE